VRGRWSRGGAAIGLGLVLLWVSGGIGTFLFLSSHRTTVNRHAARPGDAAAPVNPALARLPGTLYLVQDGALYRLQQGRFTNVLKAGGWSQPRVLPGGQGLVLVKRDPTGFSDLYRVDAGGGLQQLTHDAGRGAVPGKDPGGQLVTQYWAMYPQPSVDGRNLWYVTDQYKHIRCCPFDITMRVAQMPLAGGTPKFWTVDAVTPANAHTEDGDYAGGDAEPVPLPSGAVLFVRYAYGGTTIGSQLMMLRQARGTPAGLTQPQDGCGQPALAPGGSKVAMVCTYGKQMTSLEVAAFDGTSLGPRQVLVSGVQAAQPAWSPDGTQLVYLAPVGAAGHFQLWSVAAPQSLPAPPPPPVRAPPGRTATAAATPVPAAAPAATGSGPAPAQPAPQQLTDNLDFDATSPIAWTA
jgi:hypothetical protein